MTDIKENTNTDTTTTESSDTEILKQSGKIMLQDDRKNFYIGLTFFSIVIAIIIIIIVYAMKK